MKSNVAYFPRNNLLNKKFYTPVAVPNLSDLEGKLSFGDIARIGFANSIKAKLKGLIKTGCCVVKFSVKGKAIKLEPITEFSIFSILEQLIYPCLNIHSPGTLMLSVRYQKTRIEIELTREINSQPLILDIEELVKLKQRSKSINGTICYNGEQWQTLKMVINTG